MERTLKLDKDSGGGALWRRSVGNSQAEFREIFDKALD